MNTIIGLKDLRENLGNYEKKIRAGQSFVVMKRSKPIFTISPVETEEWETVLDCTKFRKGGIPASELIKMLEDI